MEKDTSNNKFEEVIWGRSLSEKEVSDINKLYDELDKLDVPEPSANMRLAFYKKLEEYKLGRSGACWRRIKWPDWLISPQVQSFVFKPAFAVIIFFAGIIVGLLINNKQADNKIISELQSTRKTLMLTMLEQPSATERLKAVNLTGQLGSPDDMVINALFTTLNNDNNVNVRLAAIETLFRYSNRPEVRKGLIEAIPNQDSPLILVTLSKAMVIMQEKDSIEKLKQLLNNEELDKTAKEQIRESILKLI